MRIRSSLIGGLLGNIFVCSSAYWGVIEDIFVCIVYSSVYSYVILFIGRLLKIYSCISYDAVLIL